ncbi:hypothetical protein IH970_03820 [candidate division KSB1 bacterium]|nr:hypothetical protein [candidate division KSB1 bacterium]
METRRRYDEIYQWSAQQEEEGRKRMKTAPAYGVIVGLLIAAIGFVIYQDMGLMVGLVVGLILGLAIYQSRRDSGLRMVLLIVTLAVEFGKHFPQALLDGGITADPRKDERDCGQQTFAVQRADHVGPAGRPVDAGTGSAAAAPLNYVIFPHVEVDGRTHTQIETRFSFREISAPGIATGDAQDVR